MPPVCPFLDVDKNGQKGGFFDCIKTKKRPSPHHPFGSSVTAHDPSDAWKMNRGTR